MTIELSQLLTVAQVAKRTPFSEPVIRSKIDRGEIKCVRIGGHVFVTEPDIRAALGDLYQPA